LHRNSAFKLSRQRIHLVKRSTFDLSDSCRLRTDLIKRSTFDLSDSCRLRTDLEARLTEEEAMRRVMSSIEVRGVCLCKYVCVFMCVYLIVCVHAFVKCIVVFV